MLSEKIIAKGLNIPLKEIDMGNGITQIISAAPDPSSMLPEVSLTPERADTDRLTVCVYGVGTVSGSEFHPPRVSYATMYEWFNSAPAYTYSFRNTYNTQGNTTGNFLSLEDIINNAALYGSGFFSLADMVANRQDALITVSSGGYVAKILASQILEGYRYYVGMGTTVRNVGLIRTGASASDYAVRFAIGQFAGTEQNGPLLVKFGDGGTTITIEFLAEPPVLPKLNLYVGAIGGSVMKYESSFIPLKLSLPLNSFLRFNIVDPDDPNSTSNNKKYYDYLNNARVYYTSSASGEPITPTVTTGNICNTQAPQYVNGGVNYPNGITLTAAGSYNLRAFAYGPGYLASPLAAFDITVTA